MASKNELAAIIAVFPWKNRGSRWLGGPRAGRLGRRPLPVAARRARGWGELVRGRGSSTAREQPHASRWRALLQACTQSGLADLCQAPQARRRVQSERLRPVLGGCWKQHDCMTGRRPIPTFNHGSESGGYAPDCHH